MIQRRADEVTLAEIERVGDLMVNPPSKDTFGERELDMTDLNAALIGGGAAIVGGLLTGFYEHARHWYNRPQLCIDYVGDNANRVESEYKKEDGTTAAQVYLRARVHNRGHLTAKGCRVFLASLTEVLPAGRNPTSFHDSKQLAWAGADFLPRDIPPGVNFYVDIVYVSKHEPGFCFLVNPRLFASQTKLASYRGTYHFSLVVTSDNAEPATCGVDVTYLGDWNGLRGVAAGRN
jgi:hypothetical protein